MSKRDTTYLHCEPREEAWKRFEKLWREAGGPLPLTMEQVPVPAARGRILAEPVFAAHSVPHYHSSAMDGIAVNSDKTVGASLRAPVTLVPEQDFVWVDTGDPLPPGCDAVIMIEDTNETDQGNIEITAPAAPWQHVRAVGEDVVAGELVVAAGRRLTAFEQAAIMAAGVSAVKVFRKPLVAVIPTGDELVAAGTSSQLAPGQIREFNSVLLTGLLEEQGAEVRTWPVCRDDVALLRNALRQALAWADMVLINAGSSAGRDDYTARVINELGQVVVHGIAIRPGTPVILGLVDRKPVLGIPGYPVSAALTCQLFALPALAHIQEQQAPQPVQVRARLSRRVASPPGREEYLRVQVAQVNREWIAVPMTRGAGNIKSLAESDGYVVIPLGSEGLEARTAVNVLLHRPSAELERSVLLAGSHDLSLDILAAMLTEYRLVASRLGSLGGLLALKRGEAHLSGAHLLDPETGQYNISYVERYLPNSSIVLIELVKRQQGLMLAPGNPLNIHNLSDVAVRQARFINRQRGAGTRVLLDYELQRLGIEPQQLSGYERELYSHMAVAQAVASGAADVGLGIYAAARALNLDFVPVAQETYHLVVPKGNLELPGVQALLEVINSNQFQRAVEELGGYDCSETGKQLLLEGR